MSDVISLRDFRPTSLCNMSYTIFSKVLTIRLSYILAYISNKQQGAFVKERLITENIGMAQEHMQCISIKAYGGNVSLKLDMEKGFDRVE